MVETDSTLLKQAVMGIVEKQISNNKPKETRQTLDRLVAEGISREEALQYISCVVTSEIFHTLEQGVVCDEAKYIKALNELPRLAATLPNEKYSAN